MSLCSGAAGIPWSRRWVDVTFPGSFISRLPSAEPHTRPGDRAEPGLAPPPGACGLGGAGDWAGGSLRSSCRAEETQDSSSPTEALTLELKAVQGYRRAAWRGGLQGGSGQPRSGGCWHLPPPPVHACAAQVSCRGRGMGSLTLASFSVSA